MWLTKQGTFLREARNSKRKVSTMIVACYRYFASRTTEPGQVATHKRSIFDANGSREAVRMAARTQKSILDSIDRPVEL